MAENRILTRALRHPKPKSETDLFKLLHKIGSHLSGPEVRLLTTISGRKIDESLKHRIKNGQDLLDAIAVSGHCDESDLESVFELLRKIKRHDLLHILHTRGRKEVVHDAMEEYLNNQVPQSNDLVAVGTSRSNQTLRIGSQGNIPSNISRASTSAHPHVQFMARTTDEPPSKRLRRTQQHLEPMLAKSSSAERFCSPPTSKQKYTCDVRLRVRAEYCDYETILQATVSSNKQDPIERQSDCFSQANIILRTRDLGYIVCDIKFSEITYLDAFWRDYLNGSLLEALKGVFITETLKQAVGNESIKLLVHVDEDDYEKGRTILLKNSNNQINTS